MSHLILFTEEALLNEVAKLKQSHPDKMCLIMRDSTLAVSFLTHQLVRDLKEKMEPADVHHAIMSGTLSFYNKPDSVIINEQLERIYRIRRPSYISRFFTLPQLLAEFLDGIVPPDHPWSKHIPNVPKLMAEFFDITSVGKDLIVEKVISEVKYAGMLDEVAVDDELCHLGLSELDYVDLIMDLEDAFEIEISDSDALKFNTVQDIVDYATAHTRLKKYKDPT